MKFNVKEIAIKTAGISAGAVAAKFADKLVPNLNPKIKGIGKVVIGAALPAFMAKNKFVENVGAGFIAVGAVELAEAFLPAIAGTNENPMAGIYGEAIRIDEDYEDHEDSVSGVSGPNANPMAGIAGDSDDDDDDNSED
jgi:hypothetical protein